MATMKPESSKMAQERAQIAKGTPVVVLDSGILQDTLVQHLDTPKPEVSSEDLEIVCVVVKRLLTLKVSKDEVIKSRAEKLMEEEVLNQQGRLNRLAHMTYTSLRSRDRVVYAKALDLLQALYALAKSASTPSPIFPLYRMALPSDRDLEVNPLDQKHDLIVLGAVIDLVPEHVPRALLPSMITTLKHYDSANLRTKIILKLLTSSVYLEEVYGDSDLVSIFLPYFQDENEISTAIALSRAVLPGVFNSELALRLLSSLDDTRHLKSWIHVAAGCTGNAILETRQLDKSTLRKTIHHLDDDLRLTAFQTLVISLKSTERMDEMAFQMIMEWFESNIRVYNSSFRSYYRTLFSKLLDHLHHSIGYSRRTLSKPPSKTRSNDSDYMRAFKAEKSACEVYVERASQFMSDIISKILLPSLSLPQSASHPRLLIALDMLDQLTTMNENPYIVDGQTTDHLLACLASEFSDIRQYALKILRAGPSPLPSYAEKKKSQLLLKSAYHRIGGVRNTDAEAGALVISIYFEKCLLPFNEQIDARHFLNDLLDSLEGRVSLVEQDVALGLQQWSMHGYFSAISHSLWTVDLSTPETVEVWTPQIKRILPLVRRLWACCQQILVDSKSGETRDHEIARAYQALQIQTEDAELPENSTDNAHLALLSNCWRAMKEASTLVLRLTEKRIITGSLGQFDHYADIGALFITWLHNVRHRGLFTSVADDFTAYIKFLKSDKMMAAAFGQEELRKLCLHWLNGELDAIAAEDISTTRRSAALPFCILALVDRDLELFKVAHSRLSKYIQDDKQLETVQVHALNILRQIMPDAKQSFSGKPFTIPTLTLAIDQFSSPSWGVSNAALLLFSVLFKGIFGSRLNNPTGSKRMLIDDFELDHPGLLVMLMQSIQPKKDSQTAESARFLVLLGLQHIDGSLSTPPVQLVLTEYTERYISDHDWKIRQAAAEAMSSLTIPQERLCKAITDLEGLVTLTSANEAHGRLMFIEALVSKLLPTEVNNPGLLATLEQATTLKSIADVPILRSVLSRILAHIPSHPPVASLFLVDPAPTEPGADLLSTSDKKNESVETTSTTIETNLDLEDVLASFDDKSPIEQNDILSIMGEKQLDNQSPIFRSRLLSLLERFTEEDEAEERRVAASACLHQVFIGRLVKDRQSTHFEDDTIRVMMLVRRILRDDDINARINGAAIVSALLVDDVPVCCERAEKLWTSWLDEKLRGDVRWRDNLVAEALDVNQIDLLLSRLGSSEQDLFATEAANLYRERARELDELDRLLSHIDLKSIDPQTVSVAHSQLQRIEQALNADEPDLSPISRTLLERVLLKKRGKLLQMIAS